MDLSPLRRPLTQHDPQQRRQCAVMLPHLSLCPISQTARCIYLQTADQRLLNITKAKSINYYRDKRSQCWHICCRWEFSQYLNKHRRPAFSTSHFYPSVALEVHIKKCFAVSTTSRTSNTRTAESDHTLHGTFILQGWWDHKSFFVFIAKLIPSLFHRDGYKIQINMFPCLLLISSKGPCSIHHLDSCSSALVIPFPYAALSSRHRSATPPRTSHQGVYDIIYKCRLAENFLIIWNTKVFDSMLFIL